MKYLMLIGFLGYCVMTFRYALGLGSRYYWALMLVGVYWPLGKALQYWHVGPILARSYISDVGFIAAFAVFGFGISITSKARISFAKGAAILGFIVALGFELLLIAVQEPYKGEFSARGDWVDVGIFVVSFPLVWLAILGLQSDYEALRAQHRPAVEPVIAPVYFPSKRVVDKKRRKKGRGRKKRTRR